MTDTRVPDHHQRPFPSPYEKALGLVFLPRTIEKMRAAGTPALDGYNYKTVGMDAILLKFLQLDPDAMEAYVKAGHTNAEIYEWVRQNARAYTADEATELNHQILDRGQRSDEERAAFEARREVGFPGRTDLRYFADLIEADEGGEILQRPLPAAAYDPGVA
jgi:hypothetical protein